MGNDRDIFFQVLSRYIDNFFLSLKNPMANLFAGPVKNWIINFVDPYVDAFFIGGTNSINSNAAEAFLKSEINSKIEKFVKEFEEERNGI